nr:retrovirus-related Pol polyprotein from transposon TNT 1-94 [Tanacetum cinerariifolium]
MSTQQDIYVVGCENRPPMLNKDNYVLWSSRIIRYARSRPNGKMIVDFIKNGPYVRRMIATLGEPDLPVLRYVTIVRQTKNLHEADFTQIYDFLKMNQDENGGNQNGLVVVLRIANQNGTGNIIAPRAEDNLDEIEEVNANCILMANLQHASTSGTQLDKAHVYDIDGSAEVQLNDNCYDNDIFNMFTQEEQYTDLLEPIPEPQLVPQNDNHVTSVAPSMVQSGGTVETSSAPNEETRAHQETVYHILIDQVAQTMHMLNPKPDSFYHPDQKMAVGYLNPLYLKQAQRKQQSLYNGNMLLEEHDPPAVYDSEETLELGQESREKMRFLKKEIKPANYAKINHLLGVFLPQTTKSKEELFLSNVSNMVTISKMISIPNEDLSDGTTPSVTRKFLNEDKNSLVTLQRVIKQKMTLEVHNWSSSAYKEVHKIISHEIVPIINQVDARMQNFEIKFLKEAAKFVRDFKSLTKEADESLDKQKSLELKIKWLLKASVRHDIMSIVKNGFVEVPSDLQTELDQCKYDKISYDKAYNDMQQKIKQLQAQLGDLKGKSSDTPSASNTLDPLNQKLETDYGIRIPSGLVHTARTKRPQPKGNTRNARVPYASKSSEAKTNVTVEDHRRILLLSKNRKTMSSKRNNIKLSIQNDKSELYVFLGTVRFGNDHIAAILGYGDPKCGNITITRVYFFEGLGHNLFSVGQFCDADLEVAFRRKSCFIRDLDGVDLLKGNRSTNLYTINLYDMALAYPICLMARATHIKSWLWHQRLSHLNFDTINDLAKNYLISDLPKFKYAKEHIFPSCEQGKIKRASHPPKPVPNSKQRLHLLHMDL